jgi:hypothetical protein
MKAQKKFAAKKILAGGNTNVSSATSPFVSRGDCPIEEKGEFRRAALSSIITPPVSALPKPQTTDSHT